MLIPVINILCSIYLWCIWRSWHYKHYPSILTNYIFQFKKIWIRIYWHDTLVIEWEYGRKTCRPIWLMSRNPTSLCFQPIFNVWLGASFNFLTFCSVNKIPAEAVMRNRVITTKKKYWIKNSFHQTVFSIQYEINVHFNAKLTSSIVLRRQ